MKTKILTIMLLFILLSFSNDLKALNGNIDFYSDGNVMPGEIWNVVSIYDTPTSHTTVNMLGGRIDVLRTFNSSTFNMSSGETYTMITWDNSISNLSGGSIYTLDTVGNSIVNLSDSVNINAISATDLSEININGGSVGGFDAYNNSKINIYSGVITSRIASKDNSVINIFGGDIREVIYAINESSLIFHGNSFYVNGNLMQYGQSARLYGISGINEYGIQYLTGTLTGVFTNGDLINTSFYIYDNADITFVPEPATVFLLSLGIIFLRTKK